MTAKHKGSAIKGQMFWTVIAAAILAVISVNGVTYLLRGAGAGVVAVARPTAFLGVWTTVTTKLGLKAFADKVHGLRERIGGSGPKE